MVQRAQWKLPPVDRFCSFFSVKSLCLWSELGQHVWLHLCPRRCEDLISATWSRFFSVPHLPPQKTTTLTHAKGRAQLWCYQHFWLFSLRRGTTLSSFSGFYNNIWKERLFGATLFQDRTPGTFQSAALRIGVLPQSAPFLTVPSVRKLRWL